MFATKCLGTLLISWDGFVSAPCSAPAACEVPLPRCCFSLASGFVLSSLTPPLPAALPLYSSSHEQTALESCTCFGSVQELHSASRLFLSFGFFRGFRASKYSSSVVTVSSPSQILHDLREKKSPYRLPTKLPEFLQRRSCLGLNE